ncbi:hypothetical protein SDRG_02566 [Saprolegnia diclina VS20]|uniref:Uncharacterized protein n=1 Tax=Saprolegnia diclina (strain VS20) TaxID=1156394 RepID=T0R0T0_SAPDV|nr:hypothetical protein SDRG_02566 [Saprolegnia diclina VS20]EQC39910.1 hypothetical protein SDRG_02566 [Saprolegnia diclina VS20]|eukprot:XP_008606384.1 hypothetical protein SDRG_02566 [Saprolegnia diclina VS20]
MSNPSTAAFEAAYDLLHAPSTFAASGALPHPAPILLTLAGMDEPLSWPLGAAQAKQIATLYPDTKVIPSSDIVIDQRYAQHYDDMLSTVYDGSVDAVVPSSDAKMVLSHMVVDDIGDAESFCLRPTDDEAICATTFGVVILWLPSAHKGGALTLTYGGQSHTVDDNTPLVETAFAATFLSTTITSEAITSGRRVALVYRLYYIDGPMHLVPPTLDAAIAAFKALGQSGVATIQRVGTELFTSDDRLSFESLMGLDMAFVDALVATGCYDVGLADLTGTTIETFLPHPSCGIPDDVVRDCRRTTIEGFLSLPPPTAPEFHGPSRAIVFWPKRHRLNLVGMAKAFFILAQRLTAQDNKDDDDAYLGISKTRELVLAAMSIFHVSNPLPIESHAMRIYLSVERQQQHVPRHLKRMQRILVALKNVELSSLFISDYITVEDVLPLVDIAPVIHSLLAMHGWGPLETAVLRLVQRWIRTHADEALHLLTSLAGLDTESPVCPSLGQALDAELFKRCYHVVRATPGLLTNKRLQNRGPIFLKGLLLLEHYVQTTVAQLYDANYVRLPPVLVTAIDAYLFPALPAVMSFDLPTHGLDLLQDIAVGLASAARCQPLLPLPVAVVDEILEAVRAMPQDYAAALRHRIDVPAAVLALASLTQRFDAGLFATCTGIWGLGMLPAVASITSQLEDTALLSPLLVDYVDSVAETLADNSVWEKAWRRPVYAAEDDAATQIGVFLFLDTVLALKLVAPNLTLAFAARWLQTLPTTLDAIDSLLLPVVVRLDQASAVYRLVAKTVVERFAAEPPLPDVTNFEMQPHPSLDNEHCYQCRNAHEFAREADKASQPCHCGRNELCPNLVRIGDADAARLCFVDTDPADKDRIFLEGSVRLEKVRQPGQVSEPEWRAHKAKVAMLARVTAFIEQLKHKLRDATHEDETRETEVPPAKRLRLL